MKSTRNSVQNPAHVSQEDVLNMQAGDVTLKSKKLEERAWVYGTLSSQGGGFQAPQLLQLPGQDLEPAGGQNSNGKRA